MIRRTLTGGGKLTPMPVVLYDTLTNEKFQTYDLSNYNSSRYEPIGVVVIPAEHDVYGTGECGIMALMSASILTPDVGESSNVSIVNGSDSRISTEDFYWLYEVGIESGIKHNNAIVNNILVKQVRYSYLPSDTTPTDPYYTKAIDGTYYNHPSYASYDSCLPSPYLNDGSRNPVYYDPRSALSDFAGKSNTEFLLSHALGQTNWKTGILVNTSDSGLYPAACSCWRYHTIGTQQGDWYLPACGELGYCCLKYKSIIETIDILERTFNKTFCYLSDTLAYWTSTTSDYITEYNRYIGLKSGFVSSVFKSSALYVRPFLREHLI